MKASLDQMIGDQVIVIGDEQTGAIPVSPVKIDLGALATPRVAGVERMRAVAVFALCLGLHAALLLLLEDRPQVTSVEEAIPVEVIFEPPPEERASEPEKAEEPPEPSAQTIDEKPATDFARAADQDVEDGKAVEPAPAQASETEAAAPAQASPVEPTPAAAEPAPDPAPPPPAPAPAKPQPRFAGLTPLPNFEFKVPLAKRGDGPKGQADPGYLSTLYGMIMRKMPALQEPIRPARGRVTFGVMSNGRIFQETIAITSGAPFLDAAALSAVRRAAPFPAPPKGGPVFIRFDYGSH
jgi:protein TonB